MLYSFVRGFHFLTHFEQGAPSFLHKWSPDDTAQAAIAHSYSNFGGGWSQSRAYDVGTMNDKVYYVRGGMEDWAYCGESATSDYPQIIEPRHLIIVHCCTFTRHLTIIITTIPTFRILGMFCSKPFGFSLRRQSTIATWFCPVTARCIG